VASALLEKKSGTFPCRVEGGRGHQEVLQEEVEREGRE
jgi:hypothetical protein